MFPVTPEGQVPSQVKLFPENLPCSCVLQVACHLESALSSHEKSNYSAYAFLYNYIRMNDIHCAFREKENFLSILDNLSLTSAGC